MYKNSDVRNMVSLIEYYEYLGVNSKYYSKICKLVGEFLETSTKKFDFHDFLLCKILEYYPSLYYTKKYKFINITEYFRKDLEENKYKYLSPWVYITQITREEYLTTSIYDFASNGNIAMIKYFNSIGMISISRISSSAINVLNSACRNGHLNIVKFILKTFPSKIKIEDCIVHTAESRNHLDVVDYIQDFFSRYYYRRG